MTTDKCLTAIQTNTSSNEEVENINKLYETIETRNYLMEVNYSTYESDDDEQITCMEFVSYQPLLNEVLAISKVAPLNEFYLSIYLLYGESKNYTIINGNVKEEKPIDKNFADQSWRLHAMEVADRKTELYNTIVEEAHKGTNDKEAFDTFISEYYESEEYLSDYIKSAEELLNEFGDRYRGHYANKGEFAFMYALNELSCDNMTSFELDYLDIEKYTEMLFDLGWSAYDYVDGYVFSVDY